MVQRVQAIEDYRNESYKTEVLQLVGACIRALQWTLALQWAAEHLHSTRLVRPSGATDRRLKSVRASRTTAELPPVEPTLLAAPVSSGGWAAAVPAAASKLSGTRTVSGSWGKVPLTRATYTFSS